MSREGSRARQTVREKDSREPVGKKTERKRGSV